MFSSNITFNQAEAAIIKRILMQNKLTIFPFVANEITDFNLVKTKRTYNTWFL